MSESQEPSKTPWNQKLFNLMMQEHDVICTESDMDAIIQVCREIDPSRPPQPVQPAEPVEGAPALEKLIEAYEHAVQYTSGVHGKAYVSKLVDAARAEAANREQQMKLSNLDWAEAHTYAQKKAKELGVPESKVDGDSYGVPAIEDLIDMIAEQAANRRPSTGEDERVAVLLSRLDAVCCILAIVDGSMPTKQELGMAYDELVSVRDDVAGIIRHLPAPSHSDVEPPWAKLRPFHFVVFECSSDLIIRDSNGDVVAKASCQEAAQMICAALNGDSK